MQIYLGMTVLWKGIGSALIVKGLTLAVEDVLSKITPWPKYVCLFFTWTSGQTTVE